MNSNQNSPNISSTYHNVVCLQDWWLIKAEKEIDGKILAIEGLTLREHRAVRMFSSAPIIKRYDMFTLKSADGITILIKGSMNKFRTIDNGFSLQVCNDFMLGFPYYWEEYAGKLFQKNFVGYDVPSSVSDLSQLTIPPSVHQVLHDSTATRERDHLVSSASENPSVMISSDTSSPLVMQVSLQEGTPRNQQTCNNNLDQEGLLHAADEEAAEGEDKIILNEKDNLCAEVCHEYESEVPKESCFQESMENSTTDTVIQVKSNSDRNCEENEDHSHATAGATMENEDKLVLNNHDNLNWDSCKERERSSKELSFSKKIDLTKNIPVLQVNEEVRKTSDVELLPTIETPVVTQDGGIDGGTLKTEGNVTSNKQFTSNCDGSNEPQIEVLEENFSGDGLETITDKICASHVNAEVIGLSDVESKLRKKTLSDKEDGDTIVLLDTSERIKRKSLRKLRTCDSISGKCSAPTGVGAKVFPDVVAKVIPAGDQSISKGSEKSGKTRHGKTRVVGRSKSKRTKLPQECEDDKVSLIEETVSAAPNSSVPDTSFDSIMEIDASASPGQGVSGFSSRLGICSDVILKDDLSKNLSIPKASDANDTNLSKVTKDVIVDLKSPSSRMGSSKKSKGNSNKTKSSLKSEGPATGKDESSKDASASREPDAKNGVSEGSSFVPADISFNDITKLSKVRGRPKRNTNHSKREEANEHSISCLQDYEGVPELHVEKKLSHSSGVGVDVILEESLSMTPCVGSSKILASAVNCSTTEDFSAQGELESNVDYSALGTLNVTTKKDAATKSSDMLANVEGTMNKNKSVDCCSEKKKNDLAETTEGFEKPGRTKLVGTKASNASGPKIDTVKSTVSPYEGRRSSSRLRNLKRKEEQTTNSKPDCKRNKFNASLAKSDAVKGGADTADGELGDRFPSDQTNVVLQAPVLSKTKEGDSIDVSQTNCMLSSVTTAAVEKANCSSAAVGAESSERSKAFINSNWLADVEQPGKAEMLKEQEESEGSKVGTPVRKTKRKSVPLSLIRKSRRIDPCLVTPESVRYGRSRSGRLLVPPLDFWRNQKVVYDVDGCIAGFQDGLSAVNSSPGSKSEPPSKNGKLM